MTEVYDITAAKAQSHFDFVRFVNCPRDKELSSRFACVDQTSGDTARILSGNNPLSTRMQHERLLLL